MNIFQLALASLLIPTAAVAAATTTKNTAPTKPVQKSVAPVKQPSNLNNLPIRQPAQQVRPVFSPSFGNTAGTTPQTPPGQIPPAAPGRLQLVPIKPVTTQVTSPAANSQQNQNALNAGGALAVTRSGNPAVPQGSTDLRTLSPATQMVRVWNAPQNVKNEALRLQNTNSKVMVTNALTNSKGYIYPSNVKNIDQVQCVSLVAAFRPDVGSVTSKWTAGKNLPDVTGQSPAPGTPIATFMKNRNYPPANNNQMDSPRLDGASGREPHAAIFIGYLKDSNGSIIRDTKGNPKGMQILEQREGHPAKIGMRYFEQGQPSAVGYPHMTLFTFPGDYMVDKAGAKAQDSFINRRKHGHEALRPALSER